MGERERKWREGHVLGGETGMTNNKARKAAGSISGLSTNYGYPTRESQKLPSRTAPG